MAFQLKNKYFILIPLVCIGFMQVHAQFRHYDYLGAGHQNEVKVIASSSASGNAENTIDGFSIQNPEQLKDASRFLAQATMGADYATIQMTAAMGYEAWLDEQFNLPPTLILEEMIEQGKSFGFEATRLPVETSLFRTAWMSTNLTAPDLLRQRVAFVLSQLFVVNDKADLFSHYGQMVAQYYDLFEKNAFTNYKELLSDVTFHQSMGRFLTFHNNPKADPANNIQPDENYAREIMQLFSIGLWELNPDGSRIVNNLGRYIPTYDNDDIDEFAEVFTGFVDAHVDWPDGEISEEEGSALILEVLTTPMRMDETRHDRSEKQLLNGLVLPANQSGLTDVDETLTHLATHPNTAPFISKSLIKFLTTSNPTSDYVRDVAAVFDPMAENNFEEVIRTILLHFNARTAVTENYTFGKLREPVVRLTNLLKAFPVLATNQLGDYGEHFDKFSIMGGQAPLGAPSVFNFFLPDYQPQGPIASTYFVAPEFQILTSTHSIGMINDLDDRIIKNEFLTDYHWELIHEHSTYKRRPYQMDLITEREISVDAEALVDRLDIILANGLLGDDTKDIIIDAVRQLEEPEEKVDMAIYLIMLSPDYVILK